MKKVAERIIKRILKENPTTKKELYKIKKEESVRAGLGRILSDSELIKYSKKEISILKRKPSRTMSGVSVIAVMTHPAKCPHGTCIFCPGGKKQGTPQSYTGHEPAALRGAHNEYDAYRQVKNRIRQYKLIGYDASKVELIIMGGTFTNTPWKYQKSFVIGCFQALNNSKKTSLEELQRMNEKARHRCVGMTIETRPDEINEKTIKRMLRLGCTRVELGVQTLNNNVLRMNKRGHSVQDVVNATRLLKNHGFKINYHIMTNMLGSTPKKDFESFKKVFSDERFHPDMLKIYPTLLIKNTGLYDLYKEKKWKPYTRKQTIKLVARMKRTIPKHVRVMRVQRDVPSFKIEQDLKNSNLRQLVQEEMKNNEWVCRCIRCREAGRNKSNIQKAAYKEYSYKASGGMEYFIEYSDNNDVLFGFIRLRSVKNTLFVRELHVYGKETMYGEKGNIQHKGIGKELMRRAENIAITNNASIIKVISGVGARGYYKKMGYVLENNYMVKKV